MRSTNTVLIKPSSYLCNMKCKYCFYMDEENNRNIKYGEFMNIKTLENIISKFLLNTYHELNLVFQGGEPLLIGIDFYYSLIKNVNKLNTNNIKINYSVQTNGTLITDEFAKFFKDNNFLIGVSLDGTESIHNKNRIFNNNEGSYNKVIEGIETLKKYNVDFNILTVTSKEICKNIEKVYNDYKNKGFSYIQYIPLIDDLNNDYSIDNKLFLTYLKKIFDHWYNDLLNNNRWYHRYFDSLLNRIALNDLSECTMNNSCGLMYGIESNGDVYPCDFYMTDNYLLGNINNNSIEDIDNKRKIIGFLNKPIQTKCKTCKYYKLCMGGCKRDIINNKNHYCEAYYKFFEYSYTKFINIIRLIKEGKI